MDGWRKVTDGKTHRGQTKFEKEDGSRKYFVEAADRCRKGQTEEQGGRNFKWREPEGRNFKKRDGGRKYLVPQLPTDGKRKRKRKKADGQEGQMRGGYVTPGGMMI
jgi:hypothetical protein